MNDIEIVLEKDDEQYGLLNIQYRYYHPKLHFSVDELLKKLPDSIWEDLLYRQIYNPAMLALLFDSPFMLHVINVTRTPTLMKLREDFKNRVIKMKWQKEDIEDFIDLIDDEYRKWGGLGKKTHQRVKDSQFFTMKLFNNPLMAGNFSKYITMLFYITFKHYPHQETERGFF